MYGSAAVVGLMLTYIIGFSNPLALGYAEKLGYAMQLTNFLRDIDEDWQQRQRQGITGQLDIPLHAAGQQRAHGP